MSSSNSILIVGATGLIGKHILNAVLTLQPHLQRLAIFTSRETVQSKGELIDSLHARGVEVFVGDIKNEDDVRGACVGIDTLISCVGRAVIAEQIDLLRWAAEAGVKKCFPSEFGTDIAYGPQSKDEPPHQLKLKVRAFIEQSQLEYTYLVVGPYPESFLQSRSDPRFGGFLVNEKKAFVLGDGSGKIGFTSMPDVGKLLVAALLHPIQSRNRALRVNSFTTTPLDIVAEFERQTRSKWSVEYTPLEDLKKLEAEAYARGDTTAPMKTLRRIWTEGGTLYEQTDNELIDAPVMDTLSNQVSQAIRLSIAG